MKRIATTDELLDMQTNFWRVMRHYRKYISQESVSMAWQSAQSDIRNAARIYAAIARSL